VSCDHKVWDGSRWVSSPESGGGPVAYIVTADMLPKAVPWWKSLWLKLASLRGLV